MKDNKEETPDLIYMPYVPSGVLDEHGNFKPEGKVLIKTRYAKKWVNPTFYGYIEELKPVEPGEDK